MVSTETMAKLLSLGIRGECYNSSSAKLWQEIALLLEQAKK